MFNPLSFKVREGDILHIVGPNGSGKTTLLRTISGLRYSGFEGEIICKQTPLLVGHHSAIKDGLTIEENLRFNLSGFAKPSSGQIKRVLEKLELGNLGDTLVRKLSIGQKRKVCLMRMFFSHQKLWVFDEPFTALDDKASDTFRAQMNRHSLANGALIITSHQSIGFADRQVKTLYLEPC